MILYCTTCKAEVDVIHRLMLSMDGNVLPFCGLLCLIEAACVLLRDSREARDMANAAQEIELTIRVGSTEKKMPYRATSLIGFINRESAYGNDLKEILNTVRSLKNDVYELTSEVEMFRMLAYRVEQQLPEIRRDDSRPEQAKT